MIFLRCFDGPRGRAVLDYCLSQVQLAVALRVCRLVTDEEDSPIGVAVMLGGGTRPATKKENDR